MATLATLVVKLTGDAGGFLGEMEKAESRTGKLLGGMGKSVQTLGTVALGGVGVVAGAAAGAGMALGKLAIDAAPVQGVRDSFAGLTETVEGGSAGMLAALEEGSAGMIAQRDLMESFNKAAQLVGMDFATQLPDAMQYLGKVAAATGQDMGFMMDSLVTGVGRMSPMILDNLGIQVKLSEATAKAADMFGVQADELDKTQQQAGMMAVVLEKLRKNTAAMPDVAGSAAAGIAQMRARFQNLKDQVGMATLPALNTLLGTVGRLTDVILPPLVDFLEGMVIPALERGAGFVDTLVSSILSGQSPIEALQTALQSLGLEQVAETIGMVAGKVQELWGIAQPYIQQAIGWISQHVELKDVLLALGIAIASVVIPAIVSLVSSIAPVIAVGVALVAIIALVRNAWETDWGGIRSFIQTNIFPLFQMLLEWLQINIPLAIQFLSDFWNLVLLPALLAVWQFISVNIIPILDALANLWLAIVKKEIELLAGIWRNILLPALRAVWQFIQDRVIPILDALATIVKDVLGPALNWLKEKILEPVRAAFEAIGGAIQSVIDYINQMADAISNVRLPDWLNPGSPTPFEMGLRGIASALREMDGMMEATFGIQGGGGQGGGMIVLAPVFLDPRDVMTAGGEIDYQLVGARLRALQEGL